MTALSFPGTTARRGARALAVLAAAAALVLVAVPPVPAAAQGLSTLRSSGAGIENTLRQQVRNAIAPTLEVRNAFAEPPRGLGAAPGGDYLAVVAGDGGLAVFDLISAREVMRTPGRGAGLAAVALGTAGAPLVALGRDGRVQLADRWSDWPGRPLDTGGRVQSIGLGGTRAYLGLSDGSVEVWDSARGRRTARGRAGSAPVTALAVTPDGRAALAGDGSGGLAVVEADGRVAAVPGGAGAPVTGAASLVGTLFVAVTARGEAMVLDAADGRILARWNAHGGPVTAVAALSDGIVTAAGDEALLWSITGKPRGALSTGGGTVTGLAPLRSSGTERVALSGPGRAVELHDPEAPARLARLFVTRRGWGAVDARGRFDGDATAFEDLVWVARSARLPAEAFATRYFEPGLLARHAAGDGRFLTPADVAVEEGILPPPEVDIDLRGRPSAPGDAVRVEVDARAPRRTQVAEIRLFHNGKRVPASAIVEDDGPDRRRSVVFEVRTVPGENLFHAVARGWADIDSPPATARLQVPGTGSGRMQVTAVGINEYAGRGLALNYAVADARAVSDMLERRASALHAGTGRVVLLDAEAGRASILSALGELRSLGPSDVATIFLAGHAVVAGGEWYFLPREADNLTDAGQARRIGISGAELAEALIDMPARRVLLIVDACYSGAILGRFDSFTQRRALHALKRSAGVAVIAATRADQQAPEYAVLGHGLLTHVLLEGMRERGGRLQADVSPRDGQVTVRELKAWVETRAPQLAAELEGRLSSRSGPRGGFAASVPVTPVGLVLGADFPLGR